MLTAPQQFGRHGTSDLFSSRASAVDISAVIAEHKSRILLQRPLLTCSNPHSSLISACQQNHIISCWWQHNLVAQKKHWNPIIFTVFETIRSTCFGKTITLISQPTTLYGRISCLFLGQAILWTMFLLIWAFWYGYALSISMPITPLLNRQISLGARKLSRSPDGWGKGVPSPCHQPLAISRRSLWRWKQYLHDHKTDAASQAWDADSTP